MISLSDVRRRSRALVASAGIAVLLAGCLTGPDYKKPDTAMPKNWSEPLEGGVSTQPAQLAQWWKGFGDATLDLLIARAIESNYDLRIAESRLREARENLTVSEAGFWPQLNASAAYARMQTEEATTSDATNNSLTFSNGGVTFNRIQPTTGRGVRVSRTQAGRIDVTPNLSSIGPGMSVSRDPATGVALDSLTIPLNKQAGTPDRHMDLYQAGFDASWELDVFGGVRRSVEASKADMEAIEENRSNVLVTLMAEVAQDYFTLRAAQSLLEIVNNNVRIQQETLDIAKARFDAGLTNNYDVKIAEAQLATLQASPPLFEATVARAIHRLGVMLGQHPGALREELISVAPLPAAPPDIPVGMPSELLLRRPDIRVAERQLAAATARIGVATAELFPKISLTGSFSGSGDVIDALNKGANQTWSVGPAIRWPVFDAGRIRANIRIQNARQEQALLAYQDTVNRSLEDVENALVNYAKERAHLEALAKALEADRKALDIAKDLYAQGLVDFLSVIDAERSLYSVDQQHTESRVAILTELVSLYKALGGGWEAVYAPAPAPEQQG